jgi:hypothetical protein
MLRRCGRSPPPVRPRVSSSALYFALMATVIATAPAVALAQTSIQQVVSAAQAQLVQRNFSVSLAQYAVAYRAVEQMPDPRLRVYFRALIQLGIAADLGGLRRYPEALPHTDAALVAANDPQNLAAPATLKAMIHHVRGAILYNMGRPEEARAMFELASREGDSAAAPWLRTLAVAH